ncbi:catalase family peroxidase [Burkholderia pseudomallei]|uniref:catalase family peroxidase n=1 Tax=Burkholderia pseudomallei TaxID=28450 RepID=UPI000537B8C7|nr:catalase family peroxidase [Burkholderia pseudomallei]KGU73873.1 catalase family protein [Burkholderia pseudomallei MSHR4304]KGV29634.1 catalase family protein [Burkholderia pseudomallei MSHR4308]
MEHPSTPPGDEPSRGFWRWALIGGAVAAVAATFGYVGGWLAPHRLTPQRLVDALQRNGGLHPGYRRNHAKGVCVTGYFEGNGAASAYSTAPFFAAVRTPVVGRFALPGGNPYAPDSSVPIRSLALRLSAPDGEQWRTGMNSMPVFPVATPRAFYEQTVAGRPDPRTGKPDPAKLKAFFDAHPETAAFRAWVKTAKPSASYVTETYYSLNAFYLVDAAGRRQAVRWRVAPERMADAGESAKAGDPNVLREDLARRIGSGPQRWHLLLTLAEPGDPIDDATRAWPATRTTIDAGTLVLDRVEAQDSGPCRDVNYDPTILPDGIRASGDPLLAARSAAYADSYLRRTSEEAGMPGAAHPLSEKR